MVFVTVPEGPGAETLAHALVTEGLAACVNRLPGIESTFRWEGQVQQDRETLLLVKTTAPAYGALERRIRELHPYEVPEVIAVPIVRGSEPYLSWLDASVTA
jgi:periplasmic divalent cation tolerance protein